MLFGVLSMPLELAMSDDLSRFQFHDRAQEAVERIKTDAARIDQLEAERTLLINATLEAASKLCNELALQELREAMSVIKADDWSECGVVVWEPDDPDQSELHPRTLLENAAKAQAFMQMEAAKHILEIDPSSIIRAVIEQTLVTEKVVKIL
jgi:hypothetical protein